MSHKRLTSRANRYNLFGEFPLHNPAERFERSDCHVEFWPKGTKNAAVRKWTTHLSSSISSFECRSLRRDPAAQLGEIDLAEDRVPVIERFTERRPGSLVSGCMLHVESDPAMES